MSSDNVVRLKPKPLDFLCEAHSWSTPTSTVASTAVALTLPSTIQVDALVPLEPVPDALHLVRDHWKKPQMRKAIAALLALYPNGPPIGRGTQELIREVIGFCKDPERAWIPPGERTIRDAIRIVWPWVFLR